MKKNHQGEGLSNRDKKLMPRKTQNWCWSCDGALVAPGAKCPRCQARDPERRLKK